MALALALIVIVIGALAFHAASPWWLTPLASNWQAMDDALLITLVICAVAFVAINLFLAYALIRFRHREGARASREHGNRKLEWWLIGLTSVGIVAMLAPGLSVYAKLISPPANALLFEVTGQQWQWHFRLPGADGKLGTTDMRFVDAANPFGMNPADPAGQDDLLAGGQELHVPLNHPVRILLRSKDVLHDFYVPEFRTRMNMVPGMVTSFWFTPIRLGRFEVLCAQLCGVGHFNMRSMVVVDDAAHFNAWVKAQPTYASLVAAASAPAPAAAGGAGAGLVRQGQLLAQARGCVACHSVDGSAGVGPGWRGLFGRSETMSDGKTVLADEAYLKQSITDPAARVVKGFAPIMPPQTFSEQELAGLLAYIKSVGAAGGPAAAAPP